jgi:8-amino-3,8-dideoxy-alpha-D-manno-octulosonate transaminase
VISLDFGKMFTCGEGGLVLTSSTELFNEVRALHDHGHEYNSALPRGRDTRHTCGFNFRMTEIQAAIASAQLAKLPQIISAHRRHKARLKEALRTLNLPIEFRDLPDAQGDNGDTLFFFTESPEVANSVVERLNAAGVGTKNVPDAIDWHYAGTWTHMLGGADKRLLAERFRQTGELLARTVSIPILIKVSDSWFEKTIDAVRTAFESVA